MADALQPNSPCASWGLPVDGELDRVVIVSPHLDDAVLGCGHFMAAHPGVDRRHGVRRQPAGVPRPDAQVGRAERDSRPATTSWRRGAHEDARRSRCSTRRPCTSTSSSTRTTPAIARYAPDVSPSRSRPRSPRSTRRSCSRRSVSRTRPRHDAPRRACSPGPRSARRRRWWCYEDNGYKHIPGMLAWRVSSLFRRKLWPTPVCPTIDADRGPQAARRSRATRRSCSRSRTTGGSAPSSPRPRPSSSGASRRPRPDGNASATCVLSAWSPAPDQNQWSGAVDLYWIPLGADAHVVRVTGKLFEAASAFIQGRARWRSLPLSAERPRSGRALRDRTGARSDRNGVARGVVAEGPVGARWAGRFRLFRYEIRRWHDGDIPDIRPQSAVPCALPAILLRSTSSTSCRRYRLRCGVATSSLTGEMWNSNSVVSWVLARGVDAAMVHPPAGVRAPGWHAGVINAARSSDPNVDDLPLVCCLCRGSRTCTSTRKTAAWSGRSQSAGRSSRRWHPSRTSGASTCWRTPRQRQAWRSSRPWARTDDLGCTRSSPLVGGGLWAFVIMSPKRRDLDRDGWYAIAADRRERRVVLRRRSGGAGRRREGPRRDQRMSMPYSDIDPRHILYEFCVDRGLWTTWTTPTQPVHRRWSLLAG